jgi:hypothetical protein
MHSSSTEYTACISDDDQWPQLLARLPADLEESVRTSGAILRARKVASAAQFLRLLLSYACNLPLDVVATWAAACGVTAISRQALNTRFRHAGAWLSVLLAQVLAARAGLTALGGMQLRLTDGTQVARPGARGTDWRIHATFDLQTLRFTQLELTDAHGGERLTRSAPGPGEVQVGDRNYGKRPGVLATVLAGAAVLVRIAWNAFPLQKPDGQPFDLLSAVRTVERGAIGAWEVRMAPSKRKDPVVSGRLVVSRLPAAEAAAARTRVRKQHRASAKKTAAGRKATQQPVTVEMAEYLLLFTTVPATLATAAQIVALYRFRWQIELAFKRWKSILDLATVTARHTQLCRTVLLAKLLLAVLTDDLCAAAEAFSPSAGRRRESATSAEHLPAIPAGLAPRAGHHPAPVVLAPLGLATAGSL